MALDEKSLERMLKAQKEALDKAKPAARPAPAPVPERTDLFEEFVRPAQPGEAPKPKGLKAAGYQFPPEQNPALTKANMAKGIGLPPAATSAAAGKEPAPPTELVEKDTLFEEYHRPDLKDKPRTGKGLRADPAQPRSAKEILKDYEPPTPQVFTPRRTPAGGTGTPADHAPTGGDAEADAANLDAEADLAAAAELTMSHSRDHGPTRTVTDEDPFRQMPNLPRETAVPAHAAPAPDPASPAVPPAPVAPLPSSFGPAARAAATAHAGHGKPSSPHVTDAPALRPGSGPRIAVVQADFNHDITTRMADDAIAYARQLGANVVHHLHVAGAFDIPLTAKLLAERPDVDAVVAVGCIIQGETGHDEVIAREVARKLADLAFQAEKPVGLAVTGPRMTKAQAEARVTAGRHAVAAVTQQWRGLQALKAAAALAH